LIDAGEGNQGSGVSLQLGVNDGDTRSIELNNSGDIIGRGDALASGQTAGVRLFSGAGEGDVTVDGDITNSGTISSETSAAILIESVDFIGAITNTGTLSGETASVDASSAADGIEFIQAGGTLNGDFIGSDNGVDSFTFASNTTNDLTIDILNDVDVTIATNSIVNVQGDRNIDGSLVSDGALSFNLGQDSLAVSGDATLNAGSQLTVNNSAVVNGGLEIGNGGLAGQVLSAGGDLVNNADTTLNNSGVINGNVDATEALGDVTINQVGGAINGNVALGVGDDSVNVSNSSINGNVDLGEGTNALTVNGGSVNGSVTGGSESDFVAVNNGAINGTLSLGEGNNAVAVNGGSISGGVNAGSGSDSLAVSNGSVSGNVALGGGNNSISVVNGSLSGSVSTGAGDDALNLSGASLNGTVALGDGNNSVNVANASINGSVNGGAGTDNVNVVSASINGAINTGGGNDNVAVANASLNGSVSLGAGNDSLLINNGSVNGNVQLGANDDTLTINGGSIAGNVELGGGNDQVNVNGGSISGQVIGQGSGVLNINAGAGNTFVSNGVVNVEDYNILSGTVLQLGNFSTAGATTTVAQGAALRFGNSVQGSGALVNNGTLILNAGLGSPELTQNGSVTLGAGSIVDVNFSAGSAFDQIGELIGATSVIDNGADFAEDSLLFEGRVNFAANALEVGVIDFASISANANNVRFGNALGAAIEQRSGQVESVAELLFRTSEANAQVFDLVAQDLSPSVSGALTQGARETSEQALRFVRDRFTTRSTDSNRTSGVWLQVFDGGLDQDSRDGVAGFNSNIDGASFGYDRKVGNWRFGGALSSADADIFDLRAQSDRAEIDSDQLIAYADYRRENWFVGGLASYTDLSYDVSRFTVFTDNNLVVGETDGELTSLGLTGGLSFKRGNINVTPFAGINYSDLSIDSFSEAGGVGLIVNYDDVAEFKSELGINIDGAKQFANWTLVPSLKVAWQHEFLEEQTALTGDVAGNPFRLIGTNSETDRFALGASLNLINKAGLILSLNYNGEFSGDADLQTGSLNIRYPF